MGGWSSEFRVKLGVHGCDSGVGIQGLGVREDSTSRSWAVGSNS